jgi:hypothetical protein
VRWLAERASLPTFTPDFECRPAKRHEREAIHALALEELGDGVSAVATMHRWFDKNKGVFYVLYQSKKSDRTETRTLRGYFCLISKTTVTLLTRPVTDDGLRLVKAKKFSAVDPSRQGEMNVLYRYEIETERAD